ncbi:Ubiquinol-cytochrome-c reductase complex assembly factor 1 [Pseudolycoriella hygida]|uniref:Ubiquinol-cytochrome-c reductase complex assembly factor 1 n=1 Tax=Pseudolycoriella hygida TaxID=35572 RepID=A0A9Q0MZZ6_9DIPT|nr:Ubiquinol-cytochrome-c reductase complex assembly factor 1 [Pseudolycoriella hygida]
MNVLRRPCVKLIQRSLDISKISTARPEFTNFHKLNGENVYSGRLGKCFASTQIVGSGTEGGAIMRFLRKITKIDSSKTRLRVSSYLMYQSVVDRLNYQELFEKFNLPNTFNSWFLITELHVWMLMVRAMAEGSEKGQDGKFMRNCIVEAMWSDVNTRAKQLSPENVTEIRKQIEILSEQFQAALITYDEGIMFDDQILAGALWRRFFEMKCDNYEHLEIMVKYVRKQTKQLETLNYHNFAIRPNIQWIDLNDV